jgi:regulator of protease activity HflC (stomatin/prohibitin superfamily)
MNPAGVAGVVSPLQVFGIDPLVVVGLLLLGLAVVTVLSAVEIVDAYEKRALTVFGEFRGLLEPGIHVVPPFVSESHVFDMRTQTIDVPKQEAITRDNSPVIANAVVYIRVMNAEKAFLEVEDYTRAVSNLAQTTLRAVLGDMELDDTLNRRREINERIRRDLAEPTDEWGVRVESVEVQEITPSRDVLNAMEQQTSAERRRRAMILEAQGERRSAVETAQGDKGSNIIRAQGEKQAQILEAQGDAVSTVLRARSADAMGERAIIDKGLETLGAIGADESTTYVLPQELTSTVGRYGKHLTGSDVASGGGLDGLEFDAGDREMLGLDDIEGILDDAGVSLDGEAAADGATGGRSARGDDRTDDGADDGDPVPDVDGVTDTVESAAAEVTDTVEAVTEEAEAAADTGAVEDPDPDPAEDGEVPPPDEVEDPDPVRDAEAVLDAEGGDPADPDAPGDPADRTGDDAEGEGPDSADEDAETDAERSD